MLLYFNAKYLHAIGPNTSRNVHIVISSATTQWHRAFHGGTVVNNALSEGIIWLASSSRRCRSRLINIRNVCDHADAEFMYCGKTVRHTLSADNYAYFVWTQRKIPQILRKGVEEYQNK